MICPKCGNECDDNQMFCNKCGTKVKFIVNDLQNETQAGHDKETEYIISGASLYEDEDEDIDRYLNRDLKANKKPDPIDELLEELEELEENDIKDYKNRSTYRSNSGTRKSNNRRKNKTDDVEDKVKESDDKDSSSEVRNDKKSKDLSNGKSGSNKKKVLIIAIVAVLSVVIAVFATLLVKRTLLTKKFDQYYSRGNEFYESENFKDARTQYISAANNAFTKEQKIVSYEMIYKIDDMLGGYVDEEMSYLESLIKLDSDNVDYYKALIILFQNNDMNSDAEALIKSAPAAIRSELESFDGTIPNVSVAEGTYNTPIEVELRATEGVTIYYTTDGSSASTSDTRKQYYSPIKFEEEGTFTLRALSVDRNGKNSKEISIKYIMDFGKVTPPSVNLDSGTYTEEKKIEVKADSDCTIYYTTDGTVPTQDSKEYKKGIKMPKGDSLYYFIAIDADGVESNVVTRAYVYKPKYAYSYDDAINSLSATLVSKSIFENKYGEFANGDVAYFDYNSVIEIEKSKYYLITCDIEDKSGIVRTTSYYAVSCDNGGCHKVMNNGDSYELSEIE